MANYQNIYPTKHEDFYFLFFHTSLFLKRTHTRHSFKSQELNSRFYHHIPQLFERVRGTMLWTSFSDCLPRLGGSRRSRWPGRRRLACTSEKWEVGRREHIRERLKSNVNTNMYIKGKQNHCLSLWLKKWCDKPSYLLKCSR